MERQRCSTHTIRFPDLEIDDTFIVFFDVCSLIEEEVDIECPDANTLKVTLKYGSSEASELDYSQDDIHYYELPRNVQSTDLIAYWSDDDFLVIREKKGNEVALVSVDNPDELAEEFQLATAATSTTTRNVERETMSTESSAKNKLQESQSESSSKHEIVYMQEKESRASSGENEEIMFQDSTISSCEHEKMDTQDCGATSNPEKSVQDKESTSESVDHPRSVQGKLRLIPIKNLPLLSNGILDENEFKAALKNIETRLECVNAYIDQLSSEKIALQKLLEKHK